MFLFFDHQSYILIDWEGSGLWFSKVFQVYHVPPSHQAFYFLFLLVVKLPCFQPDTNWGNTKQPAISRFIGNLEVMPEVSRKKNIYLIIVAGQPTPPNFSPTQTYGFNKALLTIYDTNNRQRRRYFEHIWTAGVSSCQRATQVLWGTLRTTKSHLLQWNSSELDLKTISKLHINSTSRFNHSWPNVCFLSCASIWSNIGQQKQNMPEFIFLISLNYQKSILLIWRNYCTIWIGSLSH